MRLNARIPGGEWAERGPDPPLHLAFAGTWQLTISLQYSTVRHFLKTLGHFPPLFLFLGTWITRDRTFDETKENEYTDPRD